MSVSYAPHPTSFHPYSSWGWNDPWAHAPSYFRPYHVEYVAPREPSCSRDGRKDKSSDLNSISEKPIDMLSTSPINIKDEEKSAIDPPSVKSEPKKVKKPENKKRALLSEIEAKPSRKLGLSNWQKKKPQKLTQLKEKRKFERRSPKLKFAPNHQNYWSLPHPFALQMSYVPISWNPSLDMFGYPSHSYFDPWVPHGSLYHGGLSPNCYAR
uniref:Uncharacterized protein n=1 Tax=Setaria viridis TaxID=4556 RepID=A0A4U6UTJ6_SETVI|nr:hypothetical protein SEVIR_4G041600v2 [Setaria viridis]